MTNTISKIIHNGDEFEFDTSSVSGITTTQPSNPSEGAMYYDTTNDVIKVYDGTNWNVVGDDTADINTKTFYLSDTDDLTTAQAVLDWYIAGKNPIIIYDMFNSSYKGEYILSNVNNSQIVFAKSKIEASHSSSQGYSYTKQPNILISFSDGTVTGINVANYASNGPYVLATNYDYSTPYTPQYNGSPATKKYVDDSVSVVSGDSGTTYTIKVSNSTPASGTPNSTITFVI